MSDLDRLLDSIGRERLDSYLSRQDINDMDKVELRRLILERRMTPYKAARTLYESGHSLRGMDSLLYHSRAIVDDLYQSFQDNLQDLVQRISAGDEVHVDSSRMPGVRRACAASGLQIIEDVRVRVDVGT